MFIKTRVDVCIELCIESLTKGSGSIGGGGTSGSAPAASGGGGHGQVLVFCGSKPRVEKTAELLARHLPSRLPEPLQRVMQARQDIIQSIKKACFGAIEPVLKMSILAGVAYHHGDVAEATKSIIETGYRRGHLNIIVCTTTLATGVNLPAQRVIICGIVMYTNGSVWTVDQFRQMSGRAGRGGPSQ